MTAIYFVIGFVLVLGAFIAFIGLVAARVGPVVSPRRYAVVEGLIIAGILLGTAAMIQPWVSAGLQWGFLLLLASTLAFIVWSHVTPGQTPPEASAVAPATTDRNT